MYYFLIVTHRHNPSPDSWYVVLKTKPRVRVRAHHGHDQGSHVDGKEAVAEEAYRLEERDCSSKENDVDGEDDGPTNDDEDDHRKHNLLLFISRYGDQRGQKECEYLHNSVFVIETTIKHNLLLFVGRYGDQRGQKECEYLHNSVFVLEANIKHHLLI